MESWLMEVNSIGRRAGSRRLIQRSTSNDENTGKTYQIGCML